jgi:hypothetical protein
MKASRVLTGSYFRQTASVSEASRFASSEPSGARRFAYSGEASKAGRFAYFGGAKRDASLTVQDSTGGPLRITP